MHVDGVDCCQQARKKKGGLHGRIDITSFTHTSNAAPAQRSSRKFRGPGHDLPQGQEAQHKPAGRAAGRAAAQLPPSVMAAVMVDSIQVRSTIESRPARLLAFPTQTVSPPTATTPTKWLGRASSAGDGQQRACQWQQRACQWEMTLWKILLDLSC